MLVAFKGASFKGKPSRVLLTHEIALQSAYDKQILPIQVNSCMKQMLTSKQVMELLNIKSETTLIKYERTGFVKVAIRLGNQKRYSAEHIAKLTKN